MTDKTKPLPGMPDIWSALVELDPDNLRELTSLTKLCELDEWWTWPEALAWTANRDHKNVAEIRAWVKFFPTNADPDFIAGGQYQIARAICGVAVDQLEGGLRLAIEQGRVATQGRSTPSGAYQQLKAIEWRGRALFVSSGVMQLVSPGKPAKAWLHDIVVNRAELFREFPQLRHPKPSHQQIVEWCKSYMSTAKSKGMNVAWEVFRADPKHHGLSRDDVFRVAWKDAKTKNT